MAYAAPFPAARTLSAPARSLRSPQSARSTSRPAARQATSTAAWRLTRRGRVVLGTVLSVPFVAILMVVGSVQADAETTVSAAPATSVVVVQAGESLWGIAQQIAPGADPRDVVTQIRELNALSDVPVRPGQSLVVPAFDR